MDPLLGRGSGRGAERQSSLSVRIFPESLPAKNLAKYLAIIAEDAKGQTSIDFIFSQYGIDPMMAPTLNLGDEALVNLVDDPGKFINGFESLVLRHSVLLEAYQSQFGSENRRTWVIGGGAYFFNPDSNTLILGDLSGDYLCPHNGFLTEQLTKAFPGIKLRMKSDYGAKFGMEDLLSVFADPLNQEEFSSYCQYLSNQHIA